MLGVLWAVAVEGTLYRDMDLDQRHMLDIDRGLCGMWCGAGLWDVRGDMWDVNVAI